MLLTVEDQCFRESIIDGGLNCNSSHLHGFYFPKWSHEFHRTGHGSPGLGGRCLCRVSLVGDTDLQAPASCHGQFLSLQVWPGTFFFYFFYFIVECS